MKRIIIILFLIYPIIGHGGEYHPADANCDWQISFDEFNAYNTAWRQTINWPMPPNPIPNEYVARAGYLFKNGKCYYYHGINFPISWMSDQDCDRIIDLEDDCPTDTNKTEEGVCGCGSSEDDCSPGSPEIKIEKIYFEMYLKDKFLQIPFRLYDRQSAVGEIELICNYNTNSLHCKLVNCDGYMNRILALEAKQHGTFSIEIIATDHSNKTTKKTIIIEIK